MSLGTFGSRSPLAQRSGPQVLFMPSQYSGGSHGLPSDARQMVWGSAGTTASGGQSLLTPSQFSATSQMPFFARQSAVLLASAGHEAPVPVQGSAGSQAPAKARQTLDEGKKASAGQSLCIPSQLSGVSQTPAEARQIAVLLTSVGHEALVPVQ